MNQNTGHSLADVNAAFAFSSSMVASTADWLSPDSEPSETVLPITDETVRPASESIDGNAIAMLSLLFMFAAMRGQDVRDVEKKFY